MEKTAGNLLFILHGGPGLAHDYLSPWLREVEKVCPLRFLDYPKQGDFLAVVRSVATEIERSGAKTYSLLAHSWGNHLLLELLQNFNVRPAKVVLVTPVPIRSDEMPVYFQRVRDRIHQQVDEAAVKRLLEIDTDPDPALDKELTRLIAPAYVHDKALAPSLNFRAYSRARDREISNSQGEFNYGETLKLLPETLLILGESDFLNEAMSAPYRAVACEVKVFANVGHSPFLENPQEFLKVVEDFLTR